MISGYPGFVQVTAMKRIHHGINRYEKTFNTFPAPGVKLSGDEREWRDNLNIIRKISGN
jgi:hypothetical protein